MKYCTKCGAQILDEAVVCVHCGCAAAPLTPVTQDKPNLGFAFLGFFFPLVGLILYLVFHDTHPLKARSAGKGALAGFITGVVIGILYGAFIGWMIGSLLYY